MKSKQAVSDVLNHKTPSYIPLGTYAIDCDTAQKILGHETYVRNRIKTQIAIWEGRRDEVAQSLKEDSVELFKKLSCIDLIIPFKEAALLPPASYKPPKYKKIADNFWEMENGVVYQCSYQTNDITVVKNPHKPDREGFFKEPTLNPPDESIFEAYDHLVDALGNERFLAGYSGGLNAMVTPGGMAEGLMAYILDPEMIQAAIAKNLKRQNYLDQFHIRGNVDQIFIEEDYASTSGPLMSPDLFREFCLAALKARVKNIKQYRDKVFLHCCGNTWKMLDFFVEAGVDCYQSLQTGAGMEMGKLKETYGDKLCFWGGVAVENLVSGTMEDVRKDVRCAIEKGAPNGGFILGPSHSVAYGTKYDNFMAMLDEHSKLKYKV